MPGKVVQYTDWVWNMGPQYFLHRSWHAFQKKTGYWYRAEKKYNQLKFPGSLNDWKQSEKIFYFNFAGITSSRRHPDPKLQDELDIILKNQFRYFNGTVLKNPICNKWFTHPVDGFNYDPQLHWTQFNDFTRGRDIKYIWERSRFCHLHTMIRYDHHFNDDQGQWVLQEITDWINSNPTGYGPHYISGQEIALRIINWLFALYYYADHAALTNAVFQHIMDSVYRQLHHLHTHLSFSRQLVRNNHILTESFALLLYSILFPEMPEAVQWQKKSKQIFEQEIAFQIFNDGTYLQYSMNYHRVVIQLLTGYLSICEKNNIPVAPVIFNRAKLSLNFFRACMHDVTGQVPFYGHNDGSLFFPMNDKRFDDYKPTLQALAHCLHQGFFEDETFEDNRWWGLTTTAIAAEHKYPATSIHTFTQSGYYIIKDTDSLSFIRCGAHKSRPAHADNLHLDIRHKGINILRDAGTFTYNGEEEMIQYFFGTASHNSVLLNEWDQMLKGPRFIWYYWTRLVDAEITEDEQYFTFTGTIKAFRQSGKWRNHHRTVSKKKGEPHWEIKDTVSPLDGFTMHQVWNPYENFHDHYQILAVHANGDKIEPIITGGFHAPAYGLKEKSQRIIFSSTTAQITTTIAAR